MSSAGWIFVGLLIISPFYEAAETEVSDESSESKSRPTRSVDELGKMVTAITGRNGLDFYEYGRYCGIGGDGQPVDPIDECCQKHDRCYDLANDGVCQDYGRRSVYRLEYNWRVADDKTAVCVPDDEKDQCKLLICICDAILANCLKSNIDFYDSNNKKGVNVLTILQDLDAI